MDTQNKERVTSSIPSNNSHKRIRESERDDDDEDDDDVQDVDTSSPKKIWPNAPAGTPIVVIKYEDDYESSYTSIFLNESGVMSPDLHKWFRMCCNPNIKKEIHEDDVRACLSDVLAYMTSSRGNKKDTDKDRYDLNHLKEYYYMGIEEMKKVGLDNEAVRRILKTDNSNWKILSYDEYDLYMKKRDFAPIVSFYFVITII